MPDGICASALAPKVRCNGWPELVGPASDRFIGDVDAAFGEQIFDVAQAQSEPIIEPDSKPITSDGKRWRLKEIGFIGASLPAKNCQVETSCHPTDDVDGPCTRQW